MKKRRNLSQRNKKNKKYPLINLRLVLILLLFIPLSILIIDYLAFYTGKKSYIFSPLSKEELVNKQQNINENLSFDGENEGKISKEEKTTPKIAIIFDDIGNNLHILKEIIYLKVPLTVSIIPFLPHSKESAKIAHLNNIEVMLHLPLEPINSYDFSLIKGEIASSMTAKEIKRVLNENIKSIPYVKGINNHMGSKITCDPKIMRIILKQIKRKKLFFIDSFTSSHSIAFKLSHKLGLKTGARDIFLDRAEVHRKLTSQDVIYTEKMMSELVNIAQRKGKAIGIGHPFPQTIEGLKRSLPLIERYGVKLVYASQIVN